MKTEQIQEIINMFENSSVNKLDLDCEEFNIKLEKGCTSTNAEQSISSVLKPVNTPVVKQASSVVEEAKEEVGGTWIKSPIVGTYYASRSQGSKPFIELGQQVKKGDVLCIIEAMKVMNEIHSPCDGVIRSILITNESMVEFDQDLIRIG